MRNILLVLFLCSFSSTVFANDLTRPLPGQLWGLVVVHLDPSVMSDSFKSVNPLIITYDSREICESKLIYWQKEEGGIITRDENNHMQLELEVAPSNNAGQEHMIVVCTVLDRFAPPK